MERFLLDGYKPQQLSTYALTLFRYPTKVENESVIVGKLLLFCMIENLAVPQLEVQNFTKMECCDARSNEHEANSLGPRDLHI